MTGPETGDVGAGDELPGEGAVARPQRPGADAADAGAAVHAVSGGAVIAEGVGHAGEQLRAAAAVDLRFLVADLGFEAEGVEVVAGDRVEVVAGLQLVVAGQEDAAFDADIGAGRLGGGGAGEDGRGERGDEGACHRFALGDSCGASQAGPLG